MPPPPWEGGPRTPAASSAPAPESPQRPRCPRAASGLAARAEARAGSPSLAHRPAPGSGTLLTSGSERGAAAPSGFPVADGARYPPLAFTALVSHFARRDDGKVWYCVAVVPGATSTAPTCGAAAHAAEALRWEDNRKLASESGRRRRHATSYFLFRRYADFCVLDAKIRQTVGEADGRDRDDLCRNGNWPLRQDSRRKDRDLLSRRLPTLKRAKLGAITTNSVLRERQTSLNELLTAVFEEAGRAPLLRTHSFFSDFFREWKTDTPNPPDDDHQRGIAVKVLQVRRASVCSPQRARGSLDGLRGQPATMATSVVPDYRPTRPESYVTRSEPKMEDARLCDHADYGGACSAVRSRASSTSFPAAASPAFSDANATEQQAGETHSWQGKSVVVYEAEPAAPDTYATGSKSGSTIGTRVLRLLRRRWILSQSSAARNGFRREENASFPLSELGSAFECHSPASNGAADAECTVMPKTSRNQSIEEHQAEASGADGLDFLHPAVGYQHFPFGQSHAVPEKRDANSFSAEAESPQPAGMFPEVRRDGEPFPAEAESSRVAAMSAGIRRDAQAFYPEPESSRPADVADRSAMTAFPAGDSAVKERLAKRLGPRILPLKIEHVGTVLPMREADVQVEQCSETLCSENRRHLSHQLSSLSPDVLRRPPPVAGVLHDVPTLKDGAKEPHVPCALRTPASPDACADLRQRSWVSFGLPESGPKAVKTIAVAPPRMGTPSRETAYPCSPPPTPRSTPGPSPPTPANPEYPSPRVQCKVVYDADTIVVVSIRRAAASLRALQDTVTAKFMETGVPVPDALVLGCKVAEFGIRPVPTAKEGPGGPERDRVPHRPWSYRDDRPRAGEYYGIMTEQEFRRVLVRFGSKVSLRCF